MKLSGTSNFNLSASFVTLKDDEWLAKQRIAGKVAGQTLSLLESLVKDKTTKSLLELDKIADGFIRENGCTPTFLGYHGFSGSVCISVNEQLVHGVPTDYTLKEGDAVSFDLGATYEGAIGDTAITCIFGEPKSDDHVKLIAATKEALQCGIEVARVGNRIGAIGNAIFKSARDKGYRVIEKYGGHGISENTPHDQPFVSNRALPTDGIVIQPGLTIAIEPMLVPFNASIETKVGSDGWTVYTPGFIGAHEEHTIFIHEDRTEIITAR